MSTNSLVTLLPKAVATRGKRRGIFGFVGTILLALPTIFGSVAPSALASGPSSNRILNYQINLTNAAGIPVPDGNLDVYLTIYDADTGGTQLFTACSIGADPTATPEAVTAAFLNGSASFLIGDITTLDCSAGSPVPIPDDLFNNPSLWLGVKVGTDDEMTPRKHIVSGGYAMNADRLDDLDTSSTGGTSAFVPVTDTSGNFTLTKDVDFAGGTFFVDSAGGNVGIGTTSPASLFSVGAGSLFQVDASGNVSLSSGTLTFGTKASDPAGSNGMMYYSTAYNTFRCFENSMWKDCDANSLSELTGAEVANSIDNADFAQVWTWSLTSDDNVGLTLGESSPSTAGGSPSILTVSTQATSTATPLYVKNLGDGPSFRVDDEGGDTTPFYIAADGNVAVGAESFDVDNPEKFKVEGGTNGTINIISGYGDRNGYLQLNIHNRNAGDSASSDVVATSDDGDENVNYIDMGINSSGYSSPDYTISGPHDGYLYTNGGNLVMGTQSTGMAIKFHTGDTLAGNERMRIDGDGNVGIGTTTPGSLLDVKGAFRLSGSSSGYVGFVAAASAGSTTYTLPSADGSPGYALVTDGFGNLSWGDAASKWDRTGTTLSPMNAGDDITTSGNMYTSGTGTMTSAGLLTGSAGLAISGGDTNINDSSNFDTNINTGSSTGAVNIGNASSGAVTITSGAGITLAAGAASNISSVTGDIVFQPAGSGTTATVQIGVGGAGSTTPDLLALDVKSDSGDPSGFDGAMYYNESYEKFRCFINGSWSDCDTTGGTATLQAAYNAGATITTSASTDLALTLTSGNFTASGAGAVNLTPTSASSFTSGGALTLTGGAASTWGTSSGDLALQAAGTGTTATVRVGAGGAGSATPDLFGVDVKSTSGDPTGFNGAIYYSANLNDFRCYVNGGWQSCGATAASATTLQQAYNSGATITTSGSTNVAFTLTSGNFTASGAGAVNLTPTSASSFTSAGALTFTAGAASTWSTSSGALTVDSATALNMGTSNATSLSLGRTGVTTTNNGALTVTQTLTASNGLSLTTGALNLTSTSGALALSGLSSSSINAGSNSLALVAGPLNLNTTGSGTTTIGSATSVVNLPGLTASQVVFTDSSKNLTTSGTVSISQGGTGQTSQTSAFNALSPMTTKGDIIAFDGSNNVRMPVGGTNGFVLTVDSTQANGIKWSALPSTSLQSAYNGGATITTSGATNIAFTLTSGNFTASGAGAVSLTPTSASSFTSGGALTLTGGASSTWSTSSGALTVDSAAALNLGTSNATSVSLGGTGVTTTNNGALTVTQATTLNGGLAVNTSGSITTDQTSFNLINATATTLNIGGGAGSGGINLAGGYSSTGCTIDGSTGNLTCAGSLGLGISPPTRTVDVAGNWGGNVVTSSVNSTTSATTTVSTKALAYDLFACNVTTTCSTGNGTSGAAPTRTFNITGLPDTDGTFAFITTRVTRIGVGGNPTESSTLIVQINGTQVSSSATGAANTDSLNVTENYVVARVNGAWRVIGTPSTADAADLAEWIPYVGDEPAVGEVVTLAKGSPVTVTRSSAAYDRDVVGVVSTLPFMTMGHHGAHTVKLALSGRVPVQVSTENGTIVAGDMLTTSSTPGVAMKADKAGPVIGRAMESYDGSDIGSVTVLVGTGWYTGPALADVLANIPNDGTGATDARVLAYLESQKEKATQGPWSEMLTDRVAATRAVISPLGMFVDVNATSVVANGITIHGDATAAKSITYDSSAALTGDTMRTDASGWAAASHGFADMFGSNDSLEAGDLVMVDTANTAKVSRAIKDDAHPDFLLVGVVAARPGFIAGLNEADSFPVAMQGRATVKVIGKVAIGDPITVTETAGVGAKAEEPGYVVGIALQAKDDDAQGTITVFVRPGWFNGSSVQAQNTTVSGIAPSTFDLGGATIEMAGRALTGLGALQGMDGLWNIDGNGKLTAKEAAAEKFTVTQTDTSSTLETGIMPTGETVTQVHNPALTAAARVFVTFRKDPGSSWWIDEIGDGFFVLKVRQPVVEDVPFDYWIVGVNDLRTSPKEPESTQQHPADVPAVDAPTTSEATSDQQAPATDETAAPAPAPTDDTASATPPTADGGTAATGATQDTTQDTQDASAPAPTGASTTDDSQ